MSKKTQKIDLITIAWITINNSKYIQSFKSSILKKNVKYWIKIAEDIIKYQEYSFHQQTGLEWSYIKF